MVGSDSPVAPVPQSAERVVAFFSSEYALDDRIPFAGGLGVLAADYLMEAGKQGFPMVALGLAYHAPDFSLTQAGFVQHSTLPLQLGTEGLVLTVWEKTLGSVKLYLLDAGDITRVPYGPDFWTLIKQQIILTFGGVKLLQTLGIKPALYHLNEGHTAFTILALWPKPDVPIIATKHTILSQSGLHLSREDLKKVLEMAQPQLLPDLEKIFSLGTDAQYPDLFSTNKFLFGFATRANGVSVLHVKTEKEVHPNSALFSITNGINTDRWQTQKPDQTDSELWKTHEQNRSKLVEFINSQTGSHLDPSKLTVVWARRLAEYKQPELVFSDENKLAGLPVQFIIAGNAVETSPESIEITARLSNRIKDPKYQGKIAFLPRYGLEISKILVGGADVWLNTPRIGKEACGTSTMKAGINGALLLTNPDGWIPEEDWSHGGGWILGDLYDILGNQIIPLFNNRDESGLPKSWIAHMRLIMNLIATKYTTARMLNEYKEKLYNLT